MVFDRYIFRNVLIATIFMASTLALIILLTQSLRFLELVIESGASSGVFWVLTLLALPRFFEVVLPIALMAATIFTYNKFIMDSELVVMRAAGQSPLRLARPVIILSGFIALFLMFVMMWLAPASLSKMHEMRQVIKAQYSTLLLREGVFNEFGEDLTVYIDKRGQDGQLQGIMIHDKRAVLENPVTITAQTGVIVVNDEGQRVVVYNGWRQDFNGQNKSLNKLSFDQYSIDLPEEGDVRERWQEPDERTIFQLINPDLNLARDRENLSAFSREIQRRIVTPLLAPGFALVALSFLLLGPLNRRGQFMRVIVAIASVVVIQGAFLSAISVSAHSAMGTITMYGIALGAIAFGLVALSPMSENVRRVLLFKKNKGGA